MRNLDQMAFKIRFSISYSVVQTSVSPGGKVRRLLLMQKGSLLPGSWGVENSLNLTPIYNSQV